MSSEFFARNFGRANSQGRDKAESMISVIIPTPDDDPVLLETLAALVAGIADGILRDAVIVGPSSNRIDEMAEAAGAVRHISEGTTAQMIAAAAEVARAEFCLVMAAGSVPIGAWTDALAEGVNRLIEPNDAGLLALTSRAGLGHAVKAGLINQMSLWTGRPDPRHGILAARKTLMTGANRFRFIRLDAGVSDRRVHRSSP